MKSVKAMMLSVSVLFFSSFAMAATVYVATPENGGSDATGDGSAGAPYETVTKGLEELVKVDETGTLSIGEGTFYGPHNTWTMGGKAAFKIESGITVVGAGPEKTILTLEPSATEGRVLYINHAGARVSDLTVTGGKGFSERWKYGSGVIIDSAGGILSNAVVRGNNFAYVCQNGGAVEVNGANSMITHCVITNNGYSTPNSVGSYAGGVHVLSGTVANCLIADNRSIQGAGIFPDGAAKIYNCTITRNHAVRNSESVGLNGGIRIFFPGFTVVNTIFCDNRADNATGTSGGEEFEMPASPSSYVNGFVNCAFGNTTGVEPFGVDARAIGTDCFTDPAAGDYTLAPGASAIEGGTMYDAIAAKDLAENDRVMGAAPDIGCYEYDPTKFCCGISVSSVGVFSGGEVTFTASVYGTNDEEAISYKWTVRDAAGDIIAESTEQSFTAVLEAAGGVSVSLTVTGDGGRSVSSERENAVVVTPREMFAVAGENPNARPPYEDWAHAATNLNDLLAYAVAGQTIYLGEGTFYGPERAVDGAFVVDKAIAVVGEGPEKTILTLDPAATQGRVLCVANAAALVSGVTVTGGKGLSSGGYGVFGSGVIIDGGGTISNAVIRDNNISFVQQGGGAVYARGASALLTHCVVTNNGYATPNSAGAYAGGVTAEDGVVDNCLIVDNRSIKGAGVYVRGSARIRNCTIAHNHSVRNSESTGLAGGIYNNGLTFKVMNTLFCDNRADSATGTIGGEEFELPSVAADAAAFQNAFSHCAFGNSTGVQPIGGGAKAVTTDCFMDPSSGDYTLVRGTAAIEGGDYYEGMPGIDLAGSPRVIGDWPDIGSYEFDTTQFGCGIDVSAVSVFEGETVTFAAVVYGAHEGEEIAYAWTLKNGDGVTLYESTAAAFDYAPDCAGLITASLTVTGEGGRTATETKVGVVSVRSHDIYVVAGENADSREPYEDWTHAATNLVDALAYAVGGQTVHLGEGTFFGPNNKSDGAFVVNKAITVVGAGPEKTILTLDPAATHGRVLCIANAGAFVSGLTVTGGKGYEDRYVTYGGAIILDNGGTLSNAVVRGNFLAYICQYGGAVEVKGAGSLMTHCIVTNNGYSSASPSGAYAGGVHVTDGTLRNCFVSDNHGTRGGGIGVAGSAKVYNCTVVSNSSDDTSLGVCGGIFTAGATFKTVNSIFAGNHAKHPGGGDGNEEWEVSPGADSAAFARCFSNCGFAAAAAVGEGSLAVADLDAVGFRNIEGGDFALDNHSPFYKKGLYQDWMDGAKDLAGNDRVVKFRKGTWLVDMGAYESPWVGPGFMLLLR